METETKSKDQQVLWERFQWRLKHNRIRVTGDNKGKAPATMPIMTKPVNSCSMAVPPAMNIAAPLLQTSPATAAPAI